MKHTYATPETDKTIQVLNGLVEVCRDGAQGYGEASKETQNTTFQSKFKNYSAERALLADELIKHVEELGGQAEKSGSVAGAVHREWIDIKGAITGKDDAAIINECERGEDSAKEAYEKALQETALPMAVKSLIQKQYIVVKAAHDDMRNLKQAYQSK